MLKNAGVAVENKKILVLGAGGAGRSTAAALKKAGANVYVYQRRKDKLEEVCNELGVIAAQSIENGGFDILINCTGVGMHDTEGVSPVGKSAFTGAETAVDLIYVPSRTEFMKQAEEMGLKTLNGKAMLFYQAYYADCLYLNKEPNDKEAETLYEKYLNF